MVSAGYLYQIANLQKTPRIDGLRYKIYNSIVSALELRLRVQWIM